MCNTGIISFSAICIFLLVSGAAASTEEDDGPELVEIKAPQLNGLYLPKYQVEELEYLPQDYYLKNELEKPSGGSSSEEESDEEDHSGDDYLHGFVPRYERGVFDEAPEINVPQDIQVAPQLLPQFKAGLPNFVPNEDQPKIRETRCKKPKLGKKSLFGKKKK